MSALPGCVGTLVTEVVLLTFATLYYHTSPIPSHTVLFNSTVRVEELITPQKLCQKFPYGMQSQAELQGTEPHPHTVFQTTGTAMINITYFSVLFFLFLRNAIA